jgi:hypothetical protein
MEDRIWAMSTIEILREAEVTLTISLVEALAKALRRERQERRLAGSGLGRRPAVLDRSRPAGPGEAGPVRTGAPITNNFAGQPTVQVVGRARPAKPIRPMKSRIVPEPDQIQSKPLRRSMPLEPPGS